MDQADQQFIDLRTLSRRCGLSVRTLRSLIHDPSDALTSYKLRTKVIVEWREFLRYVRRHRVHPAALESTLADGADRIIKEFKDG